MKCGSVLFDQPARFIVDLLMDWISLAELARLDSAACGRAIREQFLHYLRFKAFVANGSVRFELGYVEHFLRWFEVREVKVGALNLSTTHNEVVAKTVRGAVCGNHVHAVKVFGWVPSVPPVLSAIATACGQLKQLHLTVRGVIPDIWEILQAPRQTLSTIELDGYVRPSGCYLCPRRVPALPELRTLRVSVKEGLEWVLKLLLPATTVLETFEASCLHVDGESLLGLRNSRTTLRCLTLHDCHGITLPNLLDLAHSCTQIERLDLRNLRISLGDNVSKLGDSTHAYEGWYQWKMDAKALDEAVLAFASRCPGLSDVLVLPALLSNPVTPAGLLHVANHCGPHLQRLCMDLWDTTYTPDAADAVVDTLAAHCQHPETLWLRFDRASSDALARLITAQHCLREISVPCWRGDDTVLCAIARHGAHLTGLELLRGGNYTVQGVTTLMQACTALEIVRLEWPYCRLPKAFIKHWRQVRPAVKFETEVPGVPFWDSE